MRALVISDIHGNLHALEAVLKNAPAFDEVWNLGDMVGYGARPNEVLGVLRSLPAVHVRGNHDRVCCGLTSPQGFNPIAAEAAIWTKGNADPGQSCVAEGCAAGADPHERTLDVCAWISSA